MNRVDCTSLAFTTRVLMVVDETSEHWVDNPGGIKGNISIRLPKLLIIPAENRKEEIESPKGTLQRTMRELFEDVRDA